MGVSYPPNHRSAWVPERTLSAAPWVAERVELGKHRLRNLIKPTLMDRLHLATFSVCDVGSSDLVGIGSIF